MRSSVRRLAAAAAVTLFSAAPASAQLFFSGTSGTGTDPFGLDYILDNAFGVAAFGIPGLFAGSRPLPAGAPTITSFEIRFYGGSPLSTNVDPLDVSATRLLNVTASGFFDAAISADLTTATFTALAGTEIDPGERFFVNVVFAGTDVPTRFEAVYNGTLTVAAVPEPATLALTASGLAGVAIAASRRRRRAVTA